MNSDNTVNTMVAPACNEGQSSENTWLSSIGSRCMDNRISCRPKQRYEDFLGVVFGQPAIDVLSRMYNELEMSVVDIRLWLIKHVGWCVTDRQLYLILNDGGVVMRSYAERKRLSWKQGKMDEAIAKSRQITKSTYFIGSSVERMVRYLLQVSLSAMKLPWHIVIGDQMQLILSRYEVDIPVVVINPSTGLSCRFAVEVDSTYAHGTDEKRVRDNAKNHALEQSGWIVYRMNGDSVYPLHIVPQVVDIAVDIKRLSGTILNI